MIELTIGIFIGMLLLALLNAAKEADRKKEILVRYGKKMNDREYQSYLIIEKKIEKNIIISDVYVGKEADAVNRALRIFRKRYIYEKRS